MRNAIRDQTPEYRARGISSKPEAGSQWMLTGLVPEGSDQCEPRGNSTFQGSENDSDSSDGSKGVRCPVAGENDTPDYANYFCKYDNFYTQYMLLNTYTVMERYLASGNLIKPKEAG